MTADRRVRVATFPDGSQVMVEEYWGDSEAYVAKRDTPWETWGPPAELEEPPL